jgi:TetR/AcrR family transcriptional repressor of nem operon
MARPREFDETTVLEAAMRCFWAQGYKATSVRDLAESMGITGASLYNAFGDKRSLYRRALDHYLEQSVHDRIARLERLAPYDALCGFFAEIVARSPADRQRRGCLLVNAALDVPPEDGELRAQVAREFAGIEAFFRRCITAGQRDGSIAPAGEPAALARSLLSVLLGMRVLARTRASRAVLDDSASGILGLLKPVAGS